MVDSTVEGHHQEGVAPRSALRSGVFAVTIRFGRLERLPTVQGVIEDSTMSSTASALIPYEPGPADPFDHRKAAHLLRRSGFGAAPDEVTKAVEVGFEGTVDALFDASVAEQQDAEFQAAFDAVSGKLASFGETEGLQAWWIYRMIQSRTPLREKLTLFWHGHFATSNEKVENSWLMHRQIETLRRLALGNIRDLTLAMAHDPAMIVWLDGESNTKEHPNENFARELMELFTCGIGNYTESDVREAARAFTGWHRENANFAFRPDDHDPGRKKFLGKTGRLDGSDIVDLLMQSPATPRTLAVKLLRFFAAPEPSHDIIEEATSLLIRTRLDVKWFLRELFLSRWFYSDACYRTRLASPVEFVVGSVRTLGARWAAAELVEHLNRMGQRLYAPPNVKGWDGETNWINSSTLAARQAFAEELARLDSGENELGNSFDLAKIVPPEWNDPRKIVERLTAILVQGELSSDSRASIAGFLETPGEDEDDDMEEDEDDKAKRGAETFRDDPGVRAVRIRRALGVLLGLPEYQAY